MNYARHFSTVQTPQTEAIPGKPMVQNSAGGFAFAIDDWARLDRFLILGNEGGTYYASEKELTIENAQCVLRCAQADGPRTVKRIVEVSDSGRAPKNDPAIFALAICAGQKIKDALDAIPKVCRIGTHLFQFVEAVQEFRGWGRALRSAVGAWYEQKETDDLAYQVVKYQNRNGWSHKDVLRLCHAGGNSALYRWIVGGGLDTRIVQGVEKKKLRDRQYEGASDSLPRIVQAFEEAKKADKQGVCRLIREHNLPRECVPTEMLTDAEVWDALLDKMPMTAMVRNLATMTRVGLLAPMSKAVGKVLAELSNVERIKKSRLHPLAILLALKTYAAGRGEKSAKTWTPVPQIIDALDGAFYTAFSNVEPTGKRWLLACDVSGSMAGGGIAGTALTPREAVGALALVTAKIEPNYFITGFSHTLVDINLSRHSRLDGVCKTMAQIPMGCTDCALPMIYAQSKGIPVDVFVVLTDNETWFGNIHPCQALQQYRQKEGIGAKLVVVGMTSAGFTIADPADGGSMDVVGFDAAAPQIMADFARN